MEHQNRIFCKEVSEPCTYVKDKKTYVKECLSTNPTAALNHYDGHFSVSMDQDRHLRSELTL